MRDLTEVVEKGKKNFKTEMDDKLVVMPIDRLKPAFIENTNTLPQQKTKQVTFNLLDINSSEGE